MTITAAIVLYAVAWFMIFLIVLPLRLTTQGDVGTVVLGTPQGAPAGEAGPAIRRKAKITSLVAFVIWGLLYLTITQGWITVRDFDVMGRMPPIEDSR